MVLLCVYGICVGLHIVAICIVFFVCFLIYRVKSEIFKSEHDVLGSIFPTGGEFFTPKRFSLVEYHLSWLLDGSP